MHLKCFLCFLSIQISLEIIFQGNLCGVHFACSMNGLLWNNFFINAAMYLCMYASNCVMLCSSMLIRLKFCRVCFPVPGQWQCCLLWPADGDTQSNWICHPQMTLCNLAPTGETFTPHHHLCLSGSSFVKDINKCGLTLLYELHSFASRDFLDGHAAAYLVLASLRCHRGSWWQLLTSIQTGPTLSEALYHKPLTRGAGRWAWRRWSVWNRSGWSSLRGGSTAGALHLRHRQQPSRSSDKRAIGCVNKSDGASRLCEACWWTEPRCQRPPSPNADSSRPSLIYSAFGLHSNPASNIHSAAAATVKNIVFRLCKYFPLRGGACIPPANTVLNLSRIKCSSWIMVHAHIYIFIY